MTIVCIIQARVGSTRLPGKVLMQLAGRSVLDWTVRRVAASGVFDQIAVATTDRLSDDGLADHARTLGAHVTRGSEDDVLARYQRAAAETGASIVARVTSDCPLIDPDVLRAMMRCFQESRGLDGFTNAVIRTFPRGLDVEVMTRDALEAAAAEARDPAEREHVTPFLYRNPGRFRIGAFTQSPDHAAERWTLDTPEDFELLTRIFGAAPDPQALRQPDVLALLDANPGWRQINAGIVQKPV